MLNKNLFIITITYGLMTAIHGQRAIIFQQYMHR